LSGGGRALPAPTVPALDGSPHRARDRGRARAREEHAAPRGDGPRRELVQLTRPPGERR